MDCRRASAESACKVGLASFIEDKGVAAEGLLPAQVHVGISLEGSNPSP